MITQHESVIYINPSRILKCNHPTLNQGLHTKVILTPNLRIRIQVPKPNGRVQRLQPGLIILTQGCQYRHYTPAAAYKTHLPLCQGALGFLLEETCSHTISHVRCTVGYSMGKGWIEVCLWAEKEENRAQLSKHKLQD